MRPKLQTHISMWVQFDDGSWFFAKVLVDSGCEATFLMREGLAPKGLSYDSPNPLSFVTANPNVSLSGGSKEVGAKLFCDGCRFDHTGSKSSAVSIVIPVSMYLAGITEWDIMIGHEALASPCMGQIWSC